ncbi:hypothetical protein RIF29_34802 [Crotalaria pallida]|uniref:rRNA methyltransferase 1, mitochondrial n=1 Tax=Crotalaria pallida TaxID=3830 RepID=A0AAN9HTI2_CROPI
MYTNISKAQAFPFATKISSQPRCFNSPLTLKFQSLHFTSHHKPSQNPIFKNPISSFGTLCLMNPVKSHLQHGTRELGKLGNSNGLMLKFGGRYCRGRNFSSSSAEKRLPWLESNEVKEDRVVEKARRSKVGNSFQKDSGKKESGTTSKSSWELSIEKLEKAKSEFFSKPASSAPAAAVSEEASKEGKNGLVEKVRERKSEYGRRYEKFEENDEERRNGLVGKGRERRSDYGRRYEKFDGNDEGTGNGLVDKVRERRSDYGRRYKKFDGNDEERKNGLIDKVRERRSDYGRRYEKFDGNDVDVDEDGDDDGDDDDEMEEGVDDPRWDNIKNRFSRVARERVGYERPEFRRWDKQENWGRQTWKEATESTVPKIVGEGIYGIGPVLAALSAGRREFYALYVQEGLDLSSNNRKKKDKKGFEKVLKIAEKVGLSVKEASKHDLNMVVDNRPHQGLVLDASPLEMVKIMELEPVSIEEGKGFLWVALDEVTDPQNLGAIIRSAYYFGASGIVLCAKNSARLSGVVSKASAGSLELMELRYCKNMMQFLVSSAENGWRVLGGSVSSKAISLDEVVPGAPTVLVLGSEGTGLRPLVERSCTQLVRIPGNIPSAVNNSEFDGENTGLNCESSGKEFLSFLAVESLNVSVAAGVLIHHLIGKNMAETLPEGYRQTETTE